MSRIAWAAFLVYALSLAFASPALAQSQSSDQSSPSNPSNKECPAPNPPKAGATTASKYAGLSEPASYTVPDPGDSTKTIKVTNLSRQSCTQSCAGEGGGTISGICVSQGVCGVETTCSGQAPQKITTGQTQSAVSGTQSSESPASIVSRDFQSVTGSAAQTPASIVSQNFPQSGSNLPSVSVPASWFQTVGTEQNGSASFVNQSILTQANEALSGNSSGNSDSLSQTVPITQEQYLQTTFGTAPSGGTISVESSLPTSNGFVAATRDSSTGLSDWLQQVNGIAQNASSYGCVASTCIVLNSGNQAIVYNADSPVPGTYLLQSSGSQATGIWSALTGVSPADEAAYLQAGVLVSTPQGTMSLQMGSNIADAAGQALATDYNNSSVWDRLNAYVAGTPAGVSTSYIAPLTQTQDVTVTPPVAATPQVVNMTTISAQEYAQLCSGCTQTSQSEAVNAAPTTPVESQPLAPIASPSQNGSQDSGHVSESAQTQQNQEQTQEAGKQSAQAAAQPAAEPLQQGSSQPAPQPQGAAAAPANPQGGGQTPAGQSYAGATGGSPTNQGGAGQNNDATNAVAGFLSGLLKGLSSPAQSAPAPQPIVYSPTAPIVTIPATSDGLLSPCQTSSQTTTQQKQQSPCGATSNVPAPQLVTSLVSPQAAKGTGGTATTQPQNTNAIQTIVPGKTQGQANGNGTNSPVNSGAPPTAQKGGNNTPANPQGTQPGPTGTPNPSGTQKGGTGAPASAPGNGSAKPSSNPSNAQPSPTQPAASTPQPANGQGNGTGGGIGNGSESGVQAPAPSATNCKTMSCWAQQQLNNLKSALQNPGKLLTDVFSVGSANAAQPEYQSDIDKLKTDVTAAEHAFGVLQGLSSMPTQQEQDIMHHGAAAVKQLAQAAEGNLKTRLDSYSNKLSKLEQIAKSCNEKIPCMLDKGIYGLSSEVKNTGGQLLNDAKHYVYSLKPAVSVGQIGVAAPPVRSSVTNESTGSGEAPPAPQQTAPQITAKGAPFTGAASVYDCRQGGINGNCAQSATGWGVNPAEYSAALQLNLAKAFQTGYGQGHVGYALVKNLNTGAQMILKINDNGPLTPGRVIDLTPASMNCLAYNICNNDATYRGNVLPNVEVTVLQGQYNPGSIAPGTTPTPITGTACNYKGCAAPVPNAQVAAARVNNLTSVQNCSGSTTLCVSDPTTGAAFTCQGNQTTCQDAFQQQLALSRLCSSNPATCNANVGTYKETSSGTAMQTPEPRKIITMQNAYGATGKLARNPNIQTVSGLSSQDLINRLRASGVSVQDNSSASLSSYPHGKNQMTALMWHGDGSPGNGAGLVQLEISMNNAGRSAAQAVLQQDGTLVVVAPLDAVSFHTATTNALGPGIEIQGLNNQGANPTPAQTAAMQKITDVVMNQLGWEVGTHGTIEPGHKDALEAGPATIAYVYQGLAPGAVPSYTLTDDQGNPVLDQNGKPITTTQTPASDGTGSFLTNPDGSLFLDKNGNPVPVTPVPVTQNPVNQNLYSAPDDRPPQPAPANPWAGQQAGNPNAQYLSAAPIGQATNRTSQQTYAQSYQTYPQPLPATVTTVPATSGASTATVSITANPQSVSNGGTSEISWSSVGTSQCSVTTSAGLQLSATATSGSALSPKLYETTIFGALCKTQANSTVVATTSVTIQ